MAFFPDVPGAWRVRVSDDTGHGLDLSVDVAAPAPGDHEHGGSDAPGSVAFVLRPLAGALVIAALFGALVVAYRRKERRP